MLKNNKDVNQKGFTLIEVMVVVAIRVVEGLNLASSAKLAVTEAYASKGPSPMDRATQDAFSFTATRSVKEIEILANGAIAIDYQTTVAPDGKNSLILIPTNEPDVASPRAIDLSQSGVASWSGGWSCRSEQTSLPAKLLPAECRTGK
jgi:type IV pilus assembly protein PilA